VAQAALLTQRRLLHLALALAIPRTEAPHPQLLNQARRRRHLLHHLHLRPRRQHPLAAVMTRNMW